MIFDMTSTSYSKADEHIPMYGEMTNATSKATRSDP